MASLCSRFEVEARKTGLDHRFLAIWHLLDRGGAGRRDLVVQDELRQDDGDLVQGHARSWTLPRALREGVLEEGVVDEFPGRALPGLDGIVEPSLGLEGARIVDVHWILAERVSVAHHGRASGNGDAMNGKFVGRDALASGNGRDRS